MWFYEFFVFKGFLSFKDKVVDIRYYVENKCVKGYYCSDVKM